MKKNRVLLLCFLLVSLSGCGILGILGSIFESDDTVDPKIPVEDKVIVVIPFRDDVFTYFGSERGKDLASSVVVDVQANLDYTDLKRIYRGEGRELENHFHFYRKELSWNKVGTLVKADWILFGNIQFFTTKNPRDIALQRGRGEVKFQVYDLKKKKIIFTKEISAFYPKKVEGGVWPTGMASEEITLRIEKGLVNALARLIGREFYTYTKKKKGGLDG